MKWLLLFSLLFSSASFANPWQLVGQGTATWLWMDIYDAKLYSNQSQLPSNFLKDSSPLKLELCYLKPITKSQFIEAANQNLPVTNEAIQAEIDGLHRQYESVQPGDCYQLVYRPKTGTALILNNRTVFQTQQSGFKAIYFGLWLGQAPLSESLKQALTGGYLQEN